MSTPADLLYAKTHEWIRLAKGGSDVGITEYAQSALGDVVFVELPRVGRKVTAGEVIATVESVKAASDIYAPVAGEITEANPTLSADPGLINRDPYGAGWLFRIQADAGKDHALLSASAYAATLSS